MNKNNDKNKNNKNNNRLVDHYNNLSGSLNYLTDSHK